MGRPADHAECRRDGGSDPVVAAYLADVDVTLIDKNLALTVEERFRQLMELQRLAQELRRAPRRRGSG